MAALGMTGYNEHKNSTVDTKNSCMTLLNNGNFGTIVWLGHAGSLIQALVLILKMVLMASLDSFGPLSGIL